MDWNALNMHNAIWWCRKTWILIQVYFIAICVTILQSCCFLLQKKLSKSASNIKGKGVFFLSAKSHGGKVNMCGILYIYIYIYQWFSTRVLRNLTVLPVQSRGCVSLQFRGGFK